MDGYASCACACSPHRTVLFDICFRARVRHFVRECSDCQSAERRVQSIGRPCGKSVNGVNVVDRYELRFYAAGGSAALQVIDLGKPAPAADGVIRYNFSSRLGAWMVNGTVYEARVAAVGPGGSRLSAISNQFTFLVATPSPAPCVYSIGTASRSGGAGTTTGTVPWRNGRQRVRVDGGERLRLARHYRWRQRKRQRHCQLLGRCKPEHRTAHRPPDDCRQDIYLHASWRGLRVFAFAGLTFCDHRRNERQRWCDRGNRLRMDCREFRELADRLEWWQGIGNGTIGYTVAVNTLPSARTATISVGTASFSVTQSGSCSYVLSATTQTVTAAATTGSVTVTAGSGCSRTASSSASWLTVTAGATGSGNGTVNYSIAANSSSAARSATLTVGSATLTVTQSGGCSYTVSPTSRSFTASSATGSVTVAAAAGCSWTATRLGTWITISSGASGSGNGTVSFGIAAQTGTSSRTGTLTVGGQAVTITQAGGGVPATPAGLRITSVTP